MESGDDQQPGNGWRSGLRMQLVAVAGWTAGATALAGALYPALAASLFAFLVGLVVVTGLRTDLRRGLAVAALTIVPFVFADLALTALAASPRAGLEGPLPLLADPAARRTDVIAYLLLGAALLLASAGVADTAAAALRRAPSGSPMPEPEEQAPDAALELEAGLRQAEIEVARAAEYGREVALTLVGMDPLAGPDEAGERQRLMRLLDEGLLANVTRFVQLIDYGPAERLLVLPEESTASLRVEVGRLCQAAAERLRRPVRLALTSYPTHGESLPELLTELESDLTACRANGTIVQVAGEPVLNGDVDGPKTLFQPNGPVYRSTLVWPEGEESETEPVSSVDLDPPLGFDETDPLPAFTLADAEEEFAEPSIAPAPLPTP